MQLEMDKMKYICVRTVYGYLWVKPIIKLMYVSVVSDILDQRVCHSLGTRLLQLHAQHQVGERRIMVSYL